MGQRPRTNSPVVILTGSGVTLETIASIAREGHHVRINIETLQHVRDSNQRVQDWAALGTPIYGVTTGFGEMTHYAVPAQFKEALQTNLLRSHAAGSGELFPQSIVRAIMTARLNSLVKGYSGVSVETVSLIADFLNHGIHPAVPQQGSLGASGDLAPLSHMALGLIGEGRVSVGEELELQDAGDVLQSHDLRPLKLGYKEGLALINGTSAMTGAAALALLDAYRLLKVEILLSAIFVQCLHGSARAYDTRGHELKGHRGQIAVARSLDSILTGSALTAEHPRLMEAIQRKTVSSTEIIDTGIYIQHAYTLRCVPQILGPVLDTLDFCRGVIETELNSCNDNPLIFDAPEETFHGGNFHGQYVAMACDYLAIALTEIGVLAERQLDRIVNPYLNGELPDFLTLSDTGVSCGLMGAQYLATSIASENLNLAAPSSVNSLPSNGSNQDVVSMGLNSARRCLSLVVNVGEILGVLAAASYQAMHLVGADDFSSPAQEWSSGLAELTGPYDEHYPVFEFIQRAKDFAISGKGGDLADREIFFDSDSSRLPRPNSHGGTW